MTKKEILLVTFNIVGGGGAGDKPPALICTQDYVHNNLLVEVVIVFVCVL